MRVPPCGARLSRSAAGKIREKTGKIRKILEKSGKYTQTSRTNREKKKGGARALPEPPGGKEYWKRTGLLAKMAPPNGAPRAELEPIEIRKGSQNHPF